MLNTNTLYVIEYIAEHNAFDNSLSYNIAKQVKVVRI